MANEATLETLRAMLASATRRDEEAERRREAETAARRAEIANIAAQLTAITGAGSAPGTPVKKAKATANDEATTTKAKRDEGEEDDDDEGEGEEGEESEGEKTRQGEESGETEAKREGSVEDVGLRGRDGSRGSRRRERDVVRRGDESSTVDREVPARGGVVTKGRKFVHLPRLRAQGRHRVAHGARDARGWLLRRSRRRSQRVFQVQGGGHDVQQAREEVNKSDLRYDNDGVHT